jgi:replicative DNA helicase
MEKGVLGIFMNYPKSIYEVSFLKPEHFYHPQTKLVFDAVLNANKNSQVDLLTVMHELKKSGKLEDVGGVHFLNELINQYCRVTNLEQYARIIQEKYMLRELSRVGYETINKASESDVDAFDLMGELLNQVGEINAGVVDKQSKGIEDLLNEYQTQIEAIATGQVMGVSTFLDSLTGYFGGWQNQRLYILAGRPGMGKSAIIMNDIEHQLNNGVSVLLHNLEMTSTDLVSRLIGLRILEPQSELNKGKIQNYQAYKHERDILAKQKLFVSSKTRLSDIILTSKYYHAKESVKVIYIDYLQLIKIGGKNNRNEEVGEVSRTLKELAKTLDVPVIALAQLSRSVESRGGAKIPMLSDLRESGDIEQDADAVTFAYRPEYYGITQLEDGTDARNVIQLIVAKNRSGQNGALTFNWSGMLNKITEVKDWF